jgi:hypothetical protein
MFKYVPPIQVTVTIPSSGSKSVSLSLGINSSVTFQWGDGNNSTLSSSGTISHTYSNSGSYSISIIGTSTNAVYQFGQSGASCSPYLTAVNSWGGFNLTSLGYAFYYYSLNTED